MVNQAIIFVKAGDITQKYAYLECVLEGQAGHFCEITVSERKELEFRFVDDTVLISAQMLSSIVHESQAFLEEVIRDEAYFDTLGW